MEVGSVIRVVFRPHPNTIHSAGNITSDVPANVPVNVPVTERQQWFLDQLEQGIKCKPADIAAKWHVVEKTAKRDIGDLQKKGLVAFVGAPKTGIYKRRNLKYS